MNTSIFNKIVKKYKKCPFCGASYKTDKMSVELKDETVDISCKCGFFARFDSNGTEMSYGNKDKIGGVHDSGVGWNPNGVFCGECSCSDCSECPSRNVKE